MSLSPLTAPKHIAVVVIIVAAASGRAGAGVPGGLQLVGDKEIRIFTDRDAVGYEHAFGIMGIASSIARGAAGDL